MAYLQQINMKIQVDRYKTIKLSCYCQIAFLGATVRSKSIKKVERKSINANTKHTLLSIENSFGQGPKY